MTRAPKTGLWRASRSVFRFREPFDLDYFDKAGLEIDHGHQLVDKWDLESRPVPFDHETVLCRAVLDANYRSAAGSDLEPDQLIRPILTGTKRAPLGDDDIQIPDRLGGIAVTDLLKGNLVALFPATQGSNE